jgi:hypothetical protein
MLPPGGNVPAPTFQGPTPVSAPGVPTTGTQPWPSPLQSAGYYPPYWGGAYPYPQGR